MPYKEQLNVSAFTIVLFETVIENDTTNCLDDGGRNENRDQ